MITRVIKQLQLALPKPNLFYFSGSDKFNNKGKSEKVGLFGRNKNKEEKKQVPQPNKTPKHQHKSFKKKQSQHAQQQAATEPQAQKIYPNKKQTQTTKSEQPKKIEQFTLKLRKPPTQQQKKQPKIDKQQSEKGLAQSIIDEYDLANFDQQKQIEPGITIVNQKILTRAAFAQFAEQSGKVLQLFDTKQWQKLQEKLQAYESGDLPAAAIVNTIHPLFINRQPTKYVQWISKNEDLAAHLSHKLLRKVFDNLLNNQQIESVKDWTKVLENRGVDLGYEFMDLIFNLIDKNARLSTLRASIRPKIQLALFILDSISNSRPIEPKFDPETFKGHKGYMLSNWFSNLWFIVKQRHLFMTEFIQLFEQLTIKHKKRINLAEVHANGLFLEVIESYYFGSHINAVKLNDLFSHIFDKNDFRVFMFSFREILMQYKIKTGKAPFPKIDNFSQQFKQSLLLSQYKKALFYFQLSIVQGKEQPYRIFEQKPQLIKTIKIQTNIDILKDGLLCVDKSNLKRETKKRQKRQFNKQKIVNRQKAAQIQSFLSKDNKADVPYQCSMVGLNAQFIDILANRDQTQTSPQDINFDRLYQINESASQVVEQKYYLSEDDQKDQYTQIVQAAYQINQKTQRLKQIFDNSQDSQLSQRSSQEYQLQADEKVNESKLQEQQSDQYILQNEDEYQDGYEDSSQISYDVHPYILNINQLYKNQLKNECYSEKNFLRKELLKVVRLSNNPLNSVKAAIKLGKQEYAWTLFKQNIMRPLIKDRMIKNIDYVVRAFVLEHAENNHQFDIHQVMDSLYRFEYDYLDSMDREQARNQKEDYNLKKTSFLQSIYQRIQNFDQLVWENLPQGTLKHQFWESTLVLERGQELLKLQAQGKLKNIQYEREHYELQHKKIDQVFPKQLSWRDQLIYGLGIGAPEQVPLKYSQNIPGLFLKFENQQEFKEYILNPLMQKHCPPIKLRNASQHSQIEGQVAEGEQAAAQQPAQAVEGEEAQAAQGEQSQVAEGEQGQVTQSEQMQAAQGYKQAQQTAEIQKQAVQVVQSQTVLSTQQAQVQQQTGEVNLKAEQQPNAIKKGEKQQPIVQNKSIFQYSKQNKVKGYDFQAFMQINKSKLKPFFEQQYQQQQKQFKKYMFALQALVQEAYLHDNHSLQKKLVDVEAYIKDPYVIAKMTAFGLWNFDFVTISLPHQYLQRSNEFIQNFYTFKKYMGQKLPNDIPNLRKKIINNFSDIVHERKVSHQLVQELLIKRHHLFQEAEAIIRLQTDQSVNQIILWGLYNDQPLAIYMGQKLAMLTNQKIPHKLALLVARYLSHRREVPQNRVERCKQALKIVGRINREQIYELSKDYEHITVRKHLKNYIQKRNQEIDSSALVHLNRVEPTYSAQDTTFHLRNRISRGNLTV